MNIAMVIPCINQGMLGEELVAAGIRGGIQAHEQHQFMLFDDQQLDQAYKHPANLWISLSSQFNPALTVGEPVCFHWNIHSPDRIADLSLLRYDAYFLNSTRLPQEVACGPMYLLEPGAYVSPQVAQCPSYRCKAVFVGNYNNRSVAETAKVLNPLGKEDVAIWGNDAWKNSPWGSWYRGQLPAADLLACYSSADYVINITSEKRRQADMLPMRVVQALGCGKPIVSDFLPVLQSRYSELCHFYTIDPNKAKTVDPECVRDHSWEQVAARFLSHFDEFAQPFPQRHTGGLIWFWDTRFGTASSLDIFSEKTVVAMHAQGVEVQTHGHFYPSTSPLIRRLNQGSTPSTADVYVNVLGSLPDYEKFGRFRHPLIYVFWAETTTIHAKDVAYINQYQGALVQSNFSRNALKQSGVKVPVELFPHGFDPAIFQWSKRKGKRPFTFLQVGVVQKRKGTDLILRAFVELFGNAKDVRLILKSRAVDLNPHMEEVRADIVRRYGSYQNIELIEKDLDEQGIASLYTHSDVQVYPSRGEGFAMPLLEGAATGLPVIATAHGGYLDYLNDDNAWLVPISGMSRRDDLGWTNDCMWAEPDFDALKQQMWRAYEKRQELIDYGHHLYESVRDAWTWDAVIARNIQAVETLIAQCL